MALISKKSHQEKLKDQHPKLMVTSMVKYRFAWRANNEPFIRETIIFFYSSQQLHGLGLGPLKEFCANTVPLEIQVELQLIFITQHTF